MKQPDLRTLIEHASRWAEQAFARDGVIKPMWHAVKANGDHMALEAPDTNKDMAAALVRAAFELNQVVRCLFIDEAWTAVGQDELRAWINEHGNIHDYPGRVEVVAFMGEDAEQGMLAAHRRIIRGKGKPTLGPLTFEDFSHGTSSGRLIGMLPRREARMQ